MKNINKHIDTYALIPARGGSKRIKWKNLSVVNGKPLLSYAIEAAKNSRLFSRVFVNSDDDEILAEALKLGAEIYRRPVRLSHDTTFVIEVVQEMLDSLSFTDETVIGIMLPTCPLKTEYDIINAYELFLNKGGEIPVVSVSSYETPIQLAHFIGEDGRLKAVFPDNYKKSTRSTDHKTGYRYNEAIIFNTVKNLKFQRNLIGEKPFPFIMPPERSITLDYPYQLELVKILLSNS